MAQSQPAVVQQQGCQDVSLCSAVVVLCLVDGAGGLSGDACPPPPPSSARAGGSSPCASKGGYHHACLFPHHNLIKERPSDASSLVLLYH